MSFYGEMQEISKELFSEFKQGVVSYVQSTAGNGTVDNPGAATETEFELIGATVRGASFKYVSQGLAVASDLQVSHAVDNRFINPMIGGFYKIDGIKYKIMHIVKKPAAGIAVAFTCIVRK